jgi:hypothetical protein
VTVTLPDSALSAANQSWYAKQMAAENYAVNGLPSTPDFSKGTDGNAAFSGATAGTRWLTANNDSTWKGNRDAAVQFLVGKSLAGASEWTTSNSGSTWIVAGESTNVGAVWPLDSYFGLIKTAFVNTGAVDATTSASAPE